MTSRVLLLLLVLGGATWALYPTYQWYILLPESERALISLSQEEFAQASDETKQRVLELHDLRKRTLSLGLDLQGGVYVVLAPDEADLRESLMSRYSNDEDAVDAAFEREKSAAVEQVAEVLRNRLDQFGVAEPSIRTTYDASVIIEMPGLTDPQMIRQSLAQVGKLEFRLVDETSFQALMAQYPEAFNAEGLVADVNQLPEGFTLPEGSEFVPYYVNDSYGVPQLRGWYILLKQVLMDGDALQTARADVDNFGQNIVSFTLTAEGTDIFGEITRNNLNRRLAISLDGRVKSAPVIQGEIIGQGQISGSFSQKEALYLESVLRAGAFPVKIEILQEQVIGPTLGKTSIRNGFLAAVSGTALVALFMVVYYRRMGVIAVLVVLINIYLLFALLAMAGATITLSGIAGIALTVGMGVDAMVLIFERVREEMRRSRYFSHALDSGFAHAASTIWDSNLTTFMASMALSIAGFSTIKGFGVTLTFGILTNLFAALFAGRLFLDILNRVTTFKRVQPREETQNES